MRHNSRKQKTKMEGCEFYGAHKEKWVGCSFPQIVYQLHKLATNYPPWKDEGIILHPTFVFFFQCSIVEPDLCCFCLRNCDFFTCFWNIKYSCWSDSAVLQLRKSTDVFKISEKKKSQCRLTLTYTQMIVLRLSLARQQIKGELQYLEKKIDFSYKILQHLSVRLSTFLNEIFLMYIFKVSSFSFLLLHCLFFP